MLRNGIHRRKVKWENWWPLVEKLGAFPHWLRYLTYSPRSVIAQVFVSDDASAVADTLGKTWRTLAVIEDSDDVTVWGYYDEGDLSRFTNTVQRPTFNCLETPMFLKGREE